MRVIKALAVCLLCCGVCAAVIEHQFFKHDTPVKRLRGNVSDYVGAPLPSVEVEVYDQPEVWDDDALNFDQRRAKQHKVASATSDDNGVFKINAVPNGQYEVQFSRMGWNPLSVFLTVNHHSGAEKLCIELQISSGPGEGKVKDCK